MELQKKKFSLMINLLEKDIQIIHEKNISNVEKEFYKVRDLFDQAMSSQAIIDEFPYSGDNMFE